MRQNQDWQSHSDHMSLKPLLGEVLRFLMITKAPMATISPTPNAEYKQEGSGAISASESKHQVSKIVETA